MTAGYALPAIAEMDRLTEVFADAVQEIRRSLGMIRPTARQLVVALTDPIDDCLERGIRIREVAQVLGAAFSQFGVSLTESTLRTYRSHLNGDCGQGPAERLAARGMVALRLNRRKPRASDRVLAPGELTVIDRVVTRIGEVVSRFTRTVADVCVAAVERSPALTSGGVPGVGGPIRGERRAERLTGSVVEPRVAAALAEVQGKGVAAATGNTGAVSGGGVDPMKPRRAGLVDPMEDFEARVKARRQQTEERYRADEGDFFRRATEGLTVGPNGLFMKPES